MKKICNEYEVIWRIDINAKSAKDAAEQALKIQREYGSTATVFEITNKKTKNHKVIDITGP